MSIIKPEYKFLPPKGSSLIDIVVLAQAWKKTHHYVRRHNWYADGLELDASAANLEQSLAVWKACLIKDDFKTDELWLVPAPKNSKWGFNASPDLRATTNWPDLGISDLGISDLGSEPAFKDWTPKATAKQGEITQKIRPLAHLTIRDQTLATAVMMCLAEAVETLQGNPTATDGKTASVSYGNRLQCRWIKTNGDDERAVFSWGNKNSYRKYFQDYRSFLARPRKACADYVSVLPRDKDLYIVALDIKSFFDQVDGKALMVELKRIEAEYCQRFSLQDEFRSDDAFWKLVLRILDWRWREMDHARAPLIYDENTPSLKLGLPQGLMASGFFANAYMLGFDSAMQQAIQTGLEGSGGEIVLVDYCRYVDDLRIVISAPRQFSEEGQNRIQKAVEEFVTQQLQEHCSRIGADANKPLTLSLEKGSITAFRSVTNSGSFSSLMEMLSAELSGPFDFESLTQAAGGLEGLLWMTDQIDAAEPVRSRLKLSAIAAPPSDVRDDTLKRFVASRLAQSLRQRLAMSVPSGASQHHGISKERGGGDERDISREFEATARKFIKCWSENPALALLLRCGLDLFPHPRLLQPVLEALSVKLFDVGLHNSLEEQRQILAAEYVVADLLRAGSQETGCRSSEEYPDGIDIEGYREELAAFARRLLATRKDTPWYVQQQAYMYLAVVGDFSLVASCSASEELAEYRLLARVMGYEPMHSAALVRALPVALVSQQIAPKARRFGAWIQDGLKSTEDEGQQREVITLIAMNRPDLLEHVLFSHARAASEWKKYAPPAMRERPKKSPSLLSKPAGAKLSLFSVMQASDNPFRQENGLLLLAKALLGAENIADSLANGLAVTDIQICCKAWGRVNWLPTEDAFFTVGLHSPEAEPTYLYRKPDWVADDKAWLYALGRILRAAMTGEPDFTVRRYLVIEEISRYQGLVSSWSKRRLGLLNSAQGLMDEPSPVSPWLSGFISSLLQWPGIDLIDDGAASAALAKTPGELLRLVDARIAEQRALFGLRSETPIYAIPVDESAPLQDRPMRIAVVQPMRPLLADFDQKDPMHWTPTVLAQHRRHLAEVCRLASQSLKTWNSSLPPTGNDFEKSPVVDIVLFPELAVHPEHVFLLRRLADDLKASIFAGLTFIYSEKLSAPINQGLWLLRSESAEHGRSFQYVWQGKKYPTEFEKKMGVKSYRPHLTLIEFPIGGKYATRVAAAICYDATDLDLAADLRDRSDIFMVAAMNKDVQTFDNMVSALNFHMYQPVVLANSGEFGGSTAQAPLPKHDRLISHLHGNNQVGVSVFEIDPTPFKSTKAGRAPKELKTSPAGYSGRSA